MVSENKYSLVISNDYPLVKIDGNIFLLDTGAPSISMGSLNSIVINEKKFNLRQAFFNLSTAEMLASFGQKIAGIIGIDIIRTLGSLEVDLLNNSVIFGHITKEKTNVTSINNNMVAEININDQKATAFLDTGAHKIMVANHNLIDKTKFLGEVYEQSFTGTHKLEEYGATIAIGKLTKEVNVLLHNGKMPKAPGIDLYFGLNQLANEYYVIDTTKGEFYFK